jgi:hypothetical protein
LALAAGTDMKVVQEMLGHSSITITADTTQACYRRSHEQRLKLPQTSFRENGVPACSTPARLRSQAASGRFRPVSPCGVHR